jgi:hypothetical protein
VDGWLVQKTSHPGGCSAGAGSIFRLGQSKEREWQDVAEPGQFLKTSVGASEPLSLDRNGREEVEITG